MCRLQSVLSTNRSLFCLPPPWARAPFLSPVLKYEITGDLRIFVMGASPPVLVGTHPLRRRTSRRPPWGPCPRGARAQTTEQHDAIIGLLLGGCHARCEARRSENGGTLLQFHYGALHKEYALHIFDLIRGLLWLSPEGQGDQRGFGHLHFSPPLVLEQASTTSILSSMRTERNSFHIISGSFFLPVRLPTEHGVCVCVCVYRDGCRRLPVRVPLPAALGCGQGQGDDCRHNTTHNLRYTK